jgi:hypothetical protein
MVLVWAEDTETGTKPCTITHPLSQSCHWAPAGASTASPGPPVHSLDDHFLSLHLNPDTDIFLPLIFICSVMYLSSPPVEVCVVSVSIFKISFPVLTSHIDLFPFVIQTEGWDLF